MNNTRPLVSTPLVKKNTKKDLYASILRRETRGARMIPMVKPSLFAKMKRILG